MSKRSRERRAAQEGKRRRSRHRILALTAAVFFLGAIVIVWQVAGRRPADVAPTTTAQVRRIDVHDARDLTAKGDAVLLDVRARTFYDTKHAEGAVALPENEIDQLFGTIPENQQLILYCT